MIMIDTNLALKMLACFLAGSIPFAVLAMLGSGIDIRKVGSGNPGFNNVLRVSKPRAIADVARRHGQGFFAGVAADHPGDPAAYAWLFGFAAVFGHCYSPWLKFNGGKGIATSAGVMLAIFPRWAALGLAFFVLVRLLGSRRKWPEAGMIASVTTWVFFTVMLFLYGDWLSARNAA